jgi:hypothetical protein
MTAKIFHLPVRHRARSTLEEARLNAATYWLLSELNEPTVSAMRALAEKELLEPRDTIHRIWAETFLNETKDYEKKTS